MLRYIFYRLYKIQQKRHNAAMEAYVASLMFSLVILMNIYTILDVLYLYFGRTRFLQLSKLEFLLLLATIEGVVYYFFARKIQLEKTIFLYETESEKEFKKGRWVAIIYLLGSLVCQSVSFLLLAAKNKGAF